MTQDKEKPIWLRQVEFARYCRTAGADMKPETQGDILRAHREEADRREHALNTNS